MQEKNDSIDRRRDPRFIVPCSGFEFENKIYSISNISPRGLLIENSQGLDERVVNLLLSKKNFEFNLVDVPSDSKLSLTGNIVRVVRQDEVVVGLALEFKQ
ncbi:MAG: hypothetical protein HQK49_04565 [Oligoflexia bacterium]|nr:hypothetical protein [Oligoflexia bacterium]